MIHAGRFDMMVYRWQPALYRLRFQDLDFSAATVLMQVRAYRDQGGAALLSLSNGAGISISTDTLDEFLSSVIAISISEVAIESLPFTAPQGGDLRLFYDLVIQTEALGKVRWVEGEFTVRAGVTQN